MKSLVLILSSLVLIAITAFRPSFEKGKVTLTCNVNSCDKVDSLFLYEFNGVSFNKIQAAPTTDWQTYKFKLPVTGPRFYYVGKDVNNIKPLILGPEEEVSLNGSCASFQVAQVPSNLNTGYEGLKNIVTAQKNEQSQYLRQIQTAYQQDNIEQANQGAIGLGKLDKKRLSMLDSLKKANPYLAKIAALNTYLSYQNHGTGDLTEIEYFATKYFQLVDWSDPDYNHMAWVYEAVQGYTQTLASVRIPDANQKDYVDKLLHQIPVDSRTYMLALGGVINGFQTGKSPLMLNYAKRFIEKYKTSEPQAVAQLENMFKAAQSQSPGGAAPDFSMDTPDGKTLSLKDFRGKVTLVDFWASWCGPCRRENPNVVKLYQQYHSKGFDVLGVSLDKTKEPWLAAIEKDGLIWNHVSDLRGWQNSAAQLYGVTSIPHTVLLDKEGNIIARNLRGPDLDAKLAEIFGQ